MQSFTKDEEIYKFLLVLIPHAPPARLPLMLLLTEVQFYCILPAYKTLTTDLENLT